MNVAGAPRRAQSRNAAFLFTDRENAALIPEKILAGTNDFIRLFEDTTDDSALAYLKALESLVRRFPGFTHDKHGVEIRDGKYLASVVKT